VRRQVGYGRSSPRQAVERLGEILGEAARIDAELLDEAVQIGILKLKQLMQPVHQFDVRIAPQFAKYGRAFDSFVANAVKLAEKLDPADFSHEAIPLDPVFLIV
jgi:hypothetical protein